MHKEIPWQDPANIFACLADIDGLIFFDGASEASSINNYSFIALDPFATVIGKNDVFYYQNNKYKKNPFDLLQELLLEFPLVDELDLPPFQGGIAGLFGYELSRYLEKLPAANLDDMQFPDLAVGLYDLVIGFDQIKKRAWIFSSGYPQKNILLREQRALKRIIWLESLLKFKISIPSISKIFANKINLKQNFTQQSYELAVNLVKEKILAGDIFQANISRRFHLSLPDNLSAINLYWRLRKINPAPFSAYFKLSDVVIVSASPERFILMRNRQIETRPIKGTRPRGANQQQDLQFANELKQSIKDRAENIMIVDLMRNDLSRIAEDHTVLVPELCMLESHPTVHHLVSVVTAKCRKNLTAVDVLRATFPGGSVTGAPKIRAMEIITEVEPVCRGPYCGSLVYLGFNGSMDSSILIRTFAIKNNVVTFQAGGAVVADSDPTAEYEETTAKARGLMQALGLD